MTVPQSRTRQGDTWNQRRPQETKEKPKRDLKHGARATRRNQGCSANMFHKQGLSKAHQCQRPRPHGWSDRPKDGTWRRMDGLTFHFSFAPPPAPFRSPVKHSVCHPRPLRREKQGLCQRLRPHGCSDKAYGGCQRMDGLTLQFFFRASSGAVPEPIETLGEQPP